MSEVALTEIEKLRDMSINNVSSMVREMLFSDKNERLSDIDLKIIREKAMLLLQSGHSRTTIDALIESTVARLTGKKILESPFLFFAVDSAHNLVAIGNDLPKLRSKVAALTEGENPTDTNT